MERKTNIEFSHETDNINVVLPWTDDFADTYRKLYDEDITDYIPELIWERSGKYSAARSRYHNHICERFREAFSKKISGWCRENKILFTGHLLFEDGLDTQTRCIGDVMRIYPDFDIPGMDVLCGKFEFTTAKQVQSVVHQTGGKRMMSELYGVINWDSDFRDFIEQGNWQAVLGVTDRIIHLSWMSMKGAGKRDYPACFGYQAPWAEEYSIVEDYFARINNFTANGIPVVRVGILHPIESYWLIFGANDKTSEVRKYREEAFQKLCRLLLFSGINFDYISEALLPEMYSSGFVGEVQV